jgi:hypothetical protein
MNLRRAKVNKTGVRLPDYYLFLNFTRSERANLIFWGGFRNIYI